MGNIVVKHYNLVLDNEGNEREIEVSQLGNVTDGRLRMKNDVTGEDGWVKIENIERYKSMGFRPYIKGRKTVPIQSNSVTPKQKTEAPVTSVSQKAQSSNKWTPTSSTPVATKPVAKTPAPKAPVATESKEGSSFLEENKAPWQKEVKPEKAQSTPAPLKQEPFKVKRVDELQAERERQMQEQNYTERYIPEAMKISSKNIDDEISKIEAQAKQESESALKKDAILAAYGFAGRDILAKDAAIDSPEEIEKRVNAIDFEELLDNVIKDNTTQIIDEAIKSDLDYETYINRIAAPAIQRQIMKRFEQGQLDRYIPKDRFEYHLNRYMSNSLFGMLASAQNMTKAQRQYMQQGVAVAESGESKYFTPTTAERILNEAGVFASDIVALNPLTGGAMAGAVKGTTAVLGKVLPKVGEKVVEKVGENVVTKALTKWSPKLAKAIQPTVDKFGTDAQKAAYQRFMLANFMRTYPRQVARGIVPGMANVGTFMGVKGAAQEMYAGQDTSLATATKAFIDGAVEGGKFGGFLSFTSPLMGKVMSGATRPIYKPLAFIGAKSIEISGMTAFDFINCGMNVDDFILTDSLMKNAEMVGSMAIGGKPLATVKTLGKGIVRPFFNPVKSKDGKSVTYQFNPVAATRSLFGVNEDLKAAKQAMKGMRLTKDEIDYMKKYHPETLELLEGGNIKIDKAKFDEADEATADELRDLQRKYTNIMYKFDSVPLSIRQKFAAVTGIFQATKPMYDHYSIEGDYMRTFAENGECLDVFKINGKDDAERIELAQKAHNRYTSFLSSLGSINNINQLTPEMQERVRDIVFDLFVSGLKKDSKGNIQLKSGKIVSVDELKQGLISGGSFDDIISDTMERHGGAVGFLMRAFADENGVKVKDVMDALYTNPLKWTEKQNEIISTLLDSITEQMRQYNEYKNAQQFSKEEGKRLSTLPEDEVASYLNQQLEEATQGLKSIEQQAQKVIESIDALHGKSLDDVTEENMYKWQTDGTFQPENEQDIQTLYSYIGLRNKLNNVRTMQEAYKEGVENLARQQAELDLLDRTNKDTGEIVQVMYEGNPYYLISGNEESGILILKDEEGNIKSIPTSSEITEVSRDNKDELINSYIAERMSELDKLIPTKPIEEEEKGTAEKATEGNATAENKVDESDVAKPTEGTAEKTTTGDATVEKAVDNTIPLDKDGEPQLTAQGVDANAAYNYLVNQEGLTDEQITEYVDNNVKEIDKALKKIHEPKMGTSLVKYKKEKAEYESRTAELKRQREAFENIKKQIFSKEESKPVEEGNLNFLDKTDIEGIEDMPEAQIALNMPRITPESFKAETGLGAAEMRNMPGLIAKKENGGVSIVRAAERLTELFPDDHPFHDSEIIRNVIIDIISSGGARSYIKKLRERSEELSKEEREHNDALRDEFFNEQFGMSYDEYMDYIEASRENIVQKYRGVDMNELKRKHAESAERFEEYIDNKNNTEDGQKTERVGSSNELRATEGADNAGGAQASTNRGRDIRPGNKGEDSERPMGEEASSGRSVVGESGGVDDSPLSESEALEKAKDILEKGLRETAKDLGADISEESISVMRGTELRWLFNSSYVGAWAKHPIMEKAIKEAREVLANAKKNTETQKEADTTQKTTIESSQESVPKEGKGEKTISEDEQGNPVDANGKLIIDKVKSIDEIGDDDFENPKRNVQLPSLPNNVADAIGSTGKPVIIKKNIFKKNAEVHLDLEPEDSRKILTEALYNTNMYGATQPITRPDYRVAIHTGDRNSIVILDIYKGKENVEIVGWRRIDARGLEKMKRQAEREGGQILILSPENGSAAALSALPPTTSSEGKGTNNNDTTRKDNEDLSIINNPTNSSISGTESNNAKNERIEDVGEKLEGARKDALKDISRRIDNATVASLVELPFAKAYNKPDLKKAVESGALREKDAMFYDAFFSTFVNPQKPRHTKKSSFYKSIGAKTDIERWAESTYTQLQILSKFINMSESERDTFIDEMTKEHFPDREKQLAEIQKRKEYNRPLNDVNDEEYDKMWGTDTTPNQLWIMSEVLNRLGYSVGDKVDLPYHIVEANSSGKGFTILDNNRTYNVYFGTVSTIDEAIDNIVYLARLKRGDSDLKHPMESFLVQSTKYEMKESGKYAVYKGLNTHVEGTFESKEAAEAFVNKKQQKEKYIIHPIKEVARRYDYKVFFKNPLTGEKTEISDNVFDTEADAKAYIESNYEEINDNANAALIKNGQVSKVEVTADDMLSVRLTRDINSKGWSYSVVINEKYANNFGTASSLRDGFKTREEAQAFADSAKESIFKAYKEAEKERKAFVYFSTGENSRLGEDYRSGKDVGAEDFMNAFGFRGVQFGNWTNQSDRQMAVNQAFDAFMDLAKLIGVSPKALSLNGELGIAFGSRGSGKANAHYEGDTVVINLTKTRGAGSLAHEWWHALDNYFGRKSNVSHGFASVNPDFASREELVNAFRSLMDKIDGSDYAERSSLRGEYWGRSFEITARLLAEWVDSELKKKGELNTFLSRGVNTEAWQEYNYKQYKGIVEALGETPMSREEYFETKESLKGFPYPSKKEVEEFGDAVRNIFDTIQERVDEETGNVILYRTAEQGEETLNDTKKGRIIPEDVDKDVSLQIEKKFDDAIRDITKDFSDKERKYAIEDVGKRMTEASYIEHDKLTKIKKLEEQKIKEIEDELREGKYSDNMRVSSDEGYDRRRNSLLYELGVRRARVQVIEREMEYREERAKEIRKKYQVGTKDTLSFDDIEKIFNDSNTDTEVKDLFNKVSAVVKHIGLDIKTDAINNRALALANTKKGVTIDIRKFTQTRYSSQELASTILHELLHQATTSAIALYNNGGKFREKLSKEQQQACEDIINVFKDIRAHASRFKNGSKTYGLTNEYEAVAELSNTSFREGLKKRGLFDRLLNAVRRLFGIKETPTNLAKLEGAVNTLLDNFSTDIYDSIAKDGLSLLDFEGNNVGATYRLNNIKKDRIIPEDVDNEISLRIEKKFDDSIKKLLTDIDDKESAISEINRFAKTISQSIPNSRVTVLDENGGAISKTDGLTEIKEKLRLNNETAKQLLESARNAAKSLSLPASSARELETAIRELSRGIAVTDGEIAAIEREIEYRTALTQSLGKKYGVSQEGEISGDDIVRMFKDFNQDKKLSEIFDKVVECAKSLSLKFKTSDILNINSVGSFNHVNGEIKIKFSRLISSGMNKQEIASTILHELIHPITSDIIRLYELGGKYRDMLTPEQQRAANSVFDIYSELQKHQGKYLNANGKLQYGLTKPTEFLNEALSNKTFREQLKGNGVFERVIEAIKHIFGVSKLDKIDSLFDDIVKSYDLNDAKSKDLYDFVSRNANQIYGNVQERKISADDKDLIEDDKRAIEELNSGKTRKVYRAMQVIDGKLYPPMAAMIGGKLVDGVKKGDILKADEHPEQIKFVNGRPKFILNKGGKTAIGEKATSVPARYNPYWHTSNSVLNDQFKSAWIRPNMVVVEVEIPESELTSGYKAEYAKDAVGMVSWKSGSVTGQLVSQGHPGREVYLSRYCKIGKVLTDTEAAQRIKEFIGDYNVEIPVNTVTPKLRAELEKIGVKIGEPEKGIDLTEQIKEALDAGLNVDNTLRFRTMDKSKEPFYSNAQKAVESIKQDKATPEQWLAMITKNGGLKAGEDKWIGLSEWLKGGYKKDLYKKHILAAMLELNDGTFIRESDLFDKGDAAVRDAVRRNFEISAEVGKIKTEDIPVLVEKVMRAGRVNGVTKQEVLEYIAENSIKIEEVEYENIHPKLKEKLNELNDEFAQYREEAKREIEELDQMAKTYEKAKEEFEKFGNEMYDKYNGLFQNMTEEESKKFFELSRAESEAKIVFKLFHKENEKAVNEIAWNKMVEKYGDDFEIGFKQDGDKILLQDLDYAGDYLSNFVGMGKPIDSTRLGYTTEGLENKKEIALTVPTIESYNTSDEIHFGDAGEGRAVAWVRFGDATDAEGNKVLVIDEIQSKRHQEGREKGYQQKEFVDAKKELDDYVDMLDSKYGDWFDNAAETLTPEEYKTWDELWKLTNGDGRRQLEQIGKVPDAPFDKNWHELAMKRMLRYAAENGYDKIAWTTGAQQAERYSLGDKVHKIKVRNKYEDGSQKRFTITTNNAIYSGNDINADGTISSKYDIFNGKKMADVFGKELADKLINANDGDVFEDNDLMIGGEGMKGFYDQMLPRFMDKYGKKWGVKTGEVKLDLPNEADRKMWSVDVTPEMKESVMQGQPMFRTQSGEVSESKSAARNKIRSHTENLIKNLDGKGTVIENENQLDAEGRRALAVNPKATGWYNTRTGKVTVYLPNCKSVAEAEKTVLHEKVGHEGLRKFFGEKGYKNFMSDVFMHGDSEMKQWVVNYMQRNGWDLYQAIDEYYASKAEEPATYTTWEKVHNSLSNALIKLGFRKPTINDTRYIMWLSKNYIKSGVDSPMDIARRNAFINKMNATPIMESVTPDMTRYSNTENTLFRSAETGDTEGLTPEGIGAVARYNNALSKASYVWTEAHVNNLASVRAMVKAILNGRKIEDSQDIESKLTAVGSAVQPKQNLITDVVKRVVNPTILKASTYFDGETAVERKQALEEYTICKHGIERNRVLFVRDKGTDDIKSDFNELQKGLLNDLASGRISFRDYIEKMDAFIRENIDAEYDASKHDYSGLSSIGQGKYSTDRKGEYSDADVITDIVEQDGRLGGMSESLWETIRTITNMSLDNEYDGGLITRQQRDRAKSMFGFYVPLRGWSEEIAEDVYSYMTSPLVQSSRPLVKAKGRTSASASPIATAINMAYASVSHGERNKAKQYFIRLVEDNPSDLVTEVNMYGKKNEDGSVTPVYPEIKEGASADEINDAIEKYYDEINKDKDSYTLIKNAKGNIVPSAPKADNHFKEHCIDIYVGGRKRTFIVNGHPRAAQAINGMVKDNKNENAIAALRSSIVRTMSQFATTYSWSFAVANGARDALELAPAYLFSTKDSKYTGHFIANYIKLLGHGAGKTGMLGLEHRYKNGTLRNDNETDRYYKEFVDNGGITGYANMFDVEGIQSDIDKMFKRQDNKAAAAGMTIMQGVGKYGELVKTVVGSIENQTRFATYITSRKRGFSITRSIDDAKNVTVNFNRTGSGDSVSSFKIGNDTLFDRLNRDVASFTAHYLKNNVMFYNAGIQGLYNMNEALRKHGKIGAAKMLASYFITPMVLGACAPLWNNLIASLLDDDDDRKKFGDNPYAQLPDYVRRSNVTLYCGHGRWLKLPVAIDLRFGLGIGDILAGAIFDKRLRPTQIVNPEDWGSAAMQYAAEVFEQFSQITPVDFASDKVWVDQHSERNPLKKIGLGYLGAITPSWAVPFVSVANNRSWTGAPITGENIYNKYNNDPQWKKAGRGAYQILTTTSKALNDLTGGDDYSSGLIDINPSNIQYLFNQIGGGPVKDITETIHQISNLGNYISGEGEYDGKLPIAKSFYQPTTSDRTRSVTATRFYAYKDEMKDVIDDYKQYMKDERPDVRMKGIAMQYTPAYKRAQIIKEYDKVLKDVNAEINKATDKTYKDYLYSVRADIMQQAIDRIDELGSDSK